MLTLRYETEERKGRVRSYSDEEERNNVDTHVNALSTERRAEQQSAVIARVLR
jgi:hypothetical protein